ncbi:MAG TPA: flavin reductase family protein [Gaiellaceae bacterium]|nr:flavin reductase family protein [Gaiellaceae bacterium]
MAAGDELRAVLRNVPAPVTVVTVDVEGERLGLTVAAFVSLSLEPPLVGVAVSRQAAMHELLRRADAFAVNVLAAGQEHVAQHFARGVPPIGLWEGIEIREGATGAPLLEGAAGWLECRRGDVHPAGDHSFFVGEVVAAEAGPAAETLVYVRQSYSSL